MSYSNIKRIFIILTSLLAQTISKTIPEDFVDTNQPTNDISSNAATVFNLDKTNEENIETDFKTPEYNEKHAQEVIDKVNKEAEEKIQALEKQREELFVKLNKAIDSAEQSLREGDNDTTTAEGIEHLTKLRQQIKDLNEASAEDEDKDEKKEPSRRAGKDNAEEPEINEDFLLRTMWKISNQDHKHKKNDDFKREKYREGVKDRLDDWLANRIKIKKERQVKDLMLGNEKCPKYGQEGKKKNKVSKRKKGKRYPCCKKCCKASIVKCL